MCMEQNEIGFITVAICGGYIGKYPRLLGVDIMLLKARYMPFRAEYMRQWILYQYWSRWYGFSPNRHQSIIWISADLVSFEHLRTVKL